MRRAATTLGLTFVVGIVLGVVGNRSLHAREQSLKRTEALRTEVTEMEGNEAHMWVAQIAPGASTGNHSHPTTRFVYVIAGSVTLDVEGQSPKTFTVGEGFQELPDVVHNFTNASVTERATALGFQIAGRDQPLQY